MRPRRCGCGSRRRSGSRKRAPMPSRSMATSGRAKCSSSNAGHCLFAGIASPERAARVADLLTGKRFHSGWGVRTIAVGRGALQSDVLSQWLDLAARQCADRARSGALRPQEGGAVDLRGIFEFGDLRRPSPPARTVLRVRAAAAAGADQLSGGLFAPGVGGGDTIRLGRGGDRLRDRSAGRQR